MLRSEMPAIQPAVGRDHPHGDLRCSSVSPFGWLVYSEVLVIRPLVIVRVLLLMELGHSVWMAMSERMLDSGTKIAA